MACLALLMGIFVRLDAGKIRVDLEMRSGAREGNPIPAVLVLHSDARLLTAGSVLVNLEVRHTMFGETEEKILLLPLTKRVSQFFSTHRNEILRRGLRLLQRAVGTGFAETVPDSEGKTG